MSFPPTERTKQAYEHQGQPSRVAYVSAARISGWLSRFESAHGTTAQKPDTGLVRLTAADGATVELNSPWPVDHTAQLTFDELKESASQRKIILSVLIRKSSYAVSLSAGADVKAHKIGTRHIHSRTAAGGWSQKRYARRRENQSAEIIEAVARHVAELHDGESTAYGAHYLLLGGDKLLAAHVVEHDILRTLPPLPTLAFASVKEANRASLDAALAQATSIRARIWDPVALSSHP